VGQHQEGDGEGEQSGRLHHVPADPPMRDAAGRPTGRRQRRQRRRCLLGTRRPCIGLGWGGCGLGVTLTAPLPCPFICCRRLGQPGHAGP
jgi:hypothetical protein